MIEIGKQLGAGCFGRVLKGQAEGIIPGEESKTEIVAVKMVRSYADLNALASLVSELKILIHLGSHLNIVNLLGACTDVANGLNLNCLIPIYFKSISFCLFRKAISSLSSSIAISATCSTTCWPIDTVTWTKSMKMESWHN